MRAMGFEPRQAEVKRLTAKLMENEEKRGQHGDSMTMDELAELLKEKLAERGGEAEMRSAFALFDTDNKGFISIGDLKKAAEELGEKIGEEQLKVNQWGEWRSRISGNIEGDDHRGGHARSRTCD